MTRLMPKREWILHLVLASLALLGTVIAARDVEMPLLWRPELRRGHAVVPRAADTGPVRDATGFDVPRRDYRRIVVIDGLDIVLSLVPATRVVAVDSWAATHSHEAWRVADRPQVGTPPPVERILASEPDLVVTSSVGNPEIQQRIASLRSLGVAVFDLPYLITGNDLLNQVQSLGAVLNATERAAAVREQLARRLQLTRLSVPGRRGPRRAVMLSTAGSQLVLFGPDDVFDSAIVDAGMINAVVDGRGFIPVGTLERLLTIDPEVLVVRPRNRSAVEAYPGLDTLSAGGTRGIVAAVPEPYLGTAAALDYVDTVEALHDQVYARPQFGRPASSSSSR